MIKAWLTRAQYISFLVSSPPITSHSTPLVRNKLKVRVRCFFGDLQGAVEPDETDRTLTEDLLGITQEVFPAYDGL